MNEETTKAAHRLIESATAEFIKHRRNLVRDKALDHVLAPRCVNAASELLEKGFPEVAALVAALPILFHDGVDPNHEPTVTAKPLEGIFPS